MSNEERAKTVLRYYYAAALSYPAMRPYTFDAFIAKIRSIHPSFLEGLGKDLSRVSLKLSELQDNFEAYARANQGAVPSSARDVIDLYEPIKAEFDVSNVRTWVRVASDGVAEAASDLKDVAIFGGSAALVVALIALFVVGMSYMPRKN